MSFIADSMVGIHLLDTVLKKVKQLGNQDASQEDKILLPVLHELVTECWHNMSKQQCVFAANLFCAASKNVFPKQPHAYVFDIDARLKEIQQEIDLEAYHWRSQDSF